MHLLYGLQAERLGVTREEETLGHLMSYGHTGLMAVVGNRSVELAEPVLGELPLGSWQVSTQNDSRTYRSTTTAGPLAWQRQHGKLALLYEETAPRP